MTENRLGGSGLRPGASTPTGARDARVRAFHPKSKVLYRPARRQASTACEPRGQPAHGRLRRLTRHCGRREVGHSAAALPRPSGAWPRTTGWRAPSPPCSWVPAAWSRLALALLLAPTPACVLGRLLRSPGAQLVVAQYLSTDRDLTRAGRPLGGVPPDVAFRSCGSPSLSRPRHRFNPGGSGAGSRRLPGGNRWAASAHIPGGGLALCPAVRLLGPRAGDRGWKIRRFCAVLGRCRTSGLPSSP